MYYILALLLLTSSNSIANEIQIFTPSVYFSPNLDGVLDYMVFRIECSKKELVVDWKFFIKDEAGKLIKEYNADLRKKNKSSFWNFFSKPDFNSKQVSFPKEIIWTGVGTNGKIPPDGRYIYQMRAKLLDDKEIKSKEGYLYLDSNIPIAKLTADIYTFSPNADKSWDTLSIKQEVIGEATDRWRGIFWNQENEPIKTFFWEHSKVPKVLVWDGKDDRGIPQEESFFRYEIIGEDFSKNISSTSISNIYIDLKNYSTDAYASSEVFFPNGDGIDETISFKLNSSDKKIISWKFQIFNIKDQIEREWTGGNILPQELEWDGINQESKPCKTGEYYYQLVVKFSEGSSAISKKRKFLLNRNPIELNFEVLTNNFTPDGDGVEDILEIKPLVKNLNLTTWKLSLVEVYGKENSLQRKVIKKWKGLEKLPDKILWEGITDFGFLVGSLANLELYFSFRNKQNEYKTFLVKKFTTGILVLPTTNREVLKISIPEYVWKKDEKEVLSKLQKVFSHYSRYKIELLSHSKQKGDNKLNLKKTEQRAKYIFEKLFGEVAINKYYSYRGFGEIEPIFLEEDEFYQEKNDRIDFILSIPKEIP